jgi:hypothetical protein
MKRAVIFISNILSYPHPASMIEVLAMDGCLQCWMRGWRLSGLSVTRVGNVADAAMQEGTVLSVHSDMLLWGMTWFHLAFLQEHDQR